MAKRRTKKRRWHQPKRSPGLAKSFCLLESEAVEAEKMIEEMDGDSKSPSISSMDGDSKSPSVKPPWSVAADDREPPGHLFRALGTASPSRGS